MVVLLSFATVMLTARPVVGERRSAAAEQARYVSPSGSDFNDGSAKHPWSTLQHAAKRVKPGTTVYVADGTYTGPVATTVSGIRSGRIRFVSQSRWGARVRTTGAYATWTNDADFLDIVGFDVSGDGYIGILNRGSNVRIIANHVHHVPAPGCTGDGGAGIVNASYAAFDNDIVGNFVHDIGDLKTTCPRVHGIYHSTLRGYILNNISCCNQGQGVHLWHAATEVTIAHNLVFNNRYGGILIGAGDAPYNGDPAHPADRMLVANNIVVYNQNRYGMEEQGVTGPYNRYFNNVVYHNYEMDWHLQTGKQSGTITLDPEFLNYQPDGSGDYHLSAGSPAVGAGTARSMPTFDYDGHARGIKGLWDVGPYQLNSPVLYTWPPAVCDPDCVPASGSD
jgi:hypothetical protein